MNIALGILEKENGHNTEMEEENGHKKSVLPKLACGQPFKTSVLNFPLGVIAKWRSLFQERRLKPLIFLDVIFWHFCQVKLDIYFCQVKLDNLSRIFFKSQLIIV